MLDYAINDLAEEDLREACSYYNSCARGLAMQFLDAFDRAVEDLRVYPTWYPEVAPGIRRKIMHVYPFNIFYRFDSERIEVLAVYHSSRDPEKTLKRD